jgi:uncharacterized protein YgbK (DUF1537 family)
MEKHPLNPMTDASLSRLLSAQTPNAVGSNDLNTIRQGVEAVTHAWPNFRLKVCVTLSSIRWMKQISTRWRRRYTTPLC